jgi:hypothetical protein
MTLGVVVGWVEGCRSSVSFEGSLPEEVKPGEVTLSTKMGGIKLEALFSQIS